MEVILKEDVPKLGSRGDVVKVADGYGRNYLLPRKLAIEASESNRAVIEQMKQSALRRHAKDKAEPAGQPGRLHNRRHRTFATAIKRRSAARRRIPCRTVSCPAAACRPTTTR